MGELMKGVTKKTRRLDEALAERLLRESLELGLDLVQHLQKALPAIAMDGHPALTAAYKRLRPADVLCPAGQWLWQGGEMCCWSSLPAERARTFCTRR